MRPNALEAELDSYEELNEILAYDKILSEMQEERLAEAKQSRRK